MNTSPPTCPKDNLPLTAEGGLLVCARNHAYKRLAEVAILAGISRETCLESRGTSKQVSRAGKRQSLPTASESEIQASILEWLHFKGIPHTATEAKRSFNESGQLVRRISPGWPDITAIIPLHLAPALGYGGRMLVIECKSAKGKLRREQAETLQRLAKSGAVVVIARSIDDVAEAVANGVHDATKREIEKAFDMRKGK